MVRLGRHARVVAGASLFGIACCVGPAASAAEPQPEKVGKVVSLDLAGARKVTRQVAPGSYQLELRNAAPGVEYSVEMEAFQVILPPLEGGFPKTSVKGVGHTQCQARLAKLSENTLSERQVPQAVAEAAVAEGCSDAEKQTIEDLTRKATRTLSGVDVAEGDLVVTVHRRPPAGLGDKGTPESQDWVLVLTTVGRGAWLTSYGFAFAPDDDDRYFSAATGDAGKFVVTAEPNRRDFAYIPTVFFSWYSRSQLLKPWPVGLAAGVGFDETRPAAFLGLRLGHEQNVSLIAGALVRPVTRLNGQYEPGQEIGENIAPDKLVDTTYRPSYFVALSFRFGSSPFAGGSSTNLGADTKTTGAASKK